MKSIWKFFASIRLSVVVLLVIAAASVSGTVIPQNESVQVYVAKFGVVGYRILATLDMFDVYASWWFQALLFLLVINIVVCSIDRLPTTLKAVSSKRLSRNPAMYRNLMRKEIFDISLSPDAIGDACKKLVAGGDGPQQTSEGFYIIGEKGRWTRFGVYGVHLSIVLLVLGAIIGSLFGFDGYVNIPEGESVSKVRLGNGTMHELEFALQCDDFDMSFYPNGTPKEYRSSVTVLEGGQAAFKQDILVNAPLRYKGINFFQAYYGLLSVELTFKSSKTGQEYRKQVAMGDSVELPEDLGIFVLNGFQGAVDYKGRNLGPIFYGRLTSSEGQAQEEDEVQTPSEGHEKKVTQTILLPLELPEFDRLREGDVAISVSDTLYYTRLQVTRDPGVWVVYSGFIMLIVGCFVTFFTSHQRLFVEVVRQETGCRVTVAGIANKNKFGMQQEVKRVAEKLKTAVRA